MAVENIEELTEEELKDQKLEDDYFMYHDYEEHVEVHKLYVIIAYSFIRDALLSGGYITEQENEKIGLLIGKHDDSKYTKEEWLPYARRFCGPEKDKTSPEVKTAFKEAVKLHKSRNLHHWENLKNYKGQKWKCYIVELVCDYIAMGWEFDNFICEYYDKVKEEIELPKKYKEYLDSIVNNIPTLCPEAEESMTDKTLQYFYDTFEY